MQATDPDLNAVPIRCFDRAKVKAASWKDSAHKFRPGYLYGMYLVCLLPKWYSHTASLSYLWCNITTNLFAEGLPILVKDLTAVKGLPFTLVRMQGAQSVLPKPGST